MKRPYWRFNKRRQAAMFAAYALPRRARASLREFAVDHLGAGYCWKCATAYSAWPV
jgi:hypothetical protein